MIAVSESGAGSMILLYKTVRGYVGGNVEPVDFHSAGAGADCDGSLRVLGYERIGEWTAINGRRAHYAPVRRIG